MSSSQAPWYEDGLAFSCTRCGACCTGAPGYVWVDLPQIQRLAEHLGQSLETFSARHVRRVGSRYSLVERPNGDCVFWDHDSGCTVYEARPSQCRTWPFWSENLETPRDWDRTRQVCPGSGQGRVYSVDEIVQAMRRTPT
jgi:Fe-S-cluster containining protein